MKLKRLIWLFVLLFVMVPTACNSDSPKVIRHVKADPQRNELQEILDSGRLKAIVDYNSTNYFVFRGRPMGFQYELLKALADDMGVTLDIKVRNTIAETFEDLYKGKANLVAKNLTVTRQRSEVISFTYPLVETRQVLVQRKPSGWQRMKAATLEKNVIRNQLDLAGKRVHVQKNTSYATRMKNLSDEIGASIELVEDSVFGVEQLVALVAQGDIEYTVCDENVAKVNQTYYPVLDVDTPVSFPQNLAWAVRKDAGSFKEYIDEWVKNFRNTKRYARIYYKYFRSARSLARVKSDYHSINGGKISDFDDIIRKQSEQSGFDWRLIASIICQESGFNPEVVSWAGATGLMQLMPETASRFNVDNILDPIDNISGGTQFLTWLDSYFMDEIPEDEERIKFVLASYNVGLGHVLDARRLARKYGKEPNLWTGNVDFYLLNKSASKYYKDPIVKWGYCRGAEPYHYVIEVLERYQHYRNLVS